MWCLWMSIHKPTQVQFRMCNIYLLNFCTHILTLRFECGVSSISLSSSCCSSSWSSSLTCDLRDWSCSASILQNKHKKNKTNKKTHSHEQKERARLLPCLFLSVTCQRDSGACKRQPAAAWWTARGPTSDCGTYLGCASSAGTLPQTESKDSQFKVFLLCSCNWQFLP